MSGSVCGNTGDSNTQQNGCRGSICGNIGDSNIQQNGCEWINLSERGSI